MFVIRQPRDLSELSAALDLLNSTFRDHFGTFPRELPHEFFVVFDTEEDNRVLGTINLQRDGEGNGGFEVEHFFVCKVNDFYPLGSRADVGEIGRLTSKRDFITPYLFCAVTLFAQKVGVEFFVSFNRRKITRLMRASLQFGVNEYECPLRRENVPPEYEPYFYSPTDRVVVLTQPVANWERRVTELMAAANSTIKIELPVSIGNMETLLAEYQSAHPTH